MTADRDWGAFAGGLSGDAFNNLSNIYTKAMDAGFAEGLKSGEAYVSPWLHRLFDGGHSIAGAWERVQAATPDDTQLQELVGFTQAYLSDFSAHAGVPLVTISNETFRALDGVVRGAGLPFDWTRDALTCNLEEMAAALIPGLAVMLNWNNKERVEFREMLGGLLVAGAVSASPIAIAVLVVGAAREFHLQKRSNEGARVYAEAFARGGLMSGIVVTSSAVIGGPVWVGMVAGIALVMLTKQANAKIQWDQMLASIKALIKEGANTSAKPESHLYTS